MNIYEHLLPGKENALTPEYLATKYHFSSVRMLQKQIEAERKAGKVILSSTTPPGGSRAITYVGMFAAALTGQDTFVKAVGVQEDYAAGLEKTSKNTNQAAKSTKKTNKETEGYLSTLDEIQRYTSNKNDDSAADVIDIRSKGWNRTCQNRLFLCIGKYH